MLMCMSKKITNLIDQWKPRKVLADEIGASVDQVHKWAQFGRIPAEWQLSVINAAMRKGLMGIDGDWMARAHHRSPKADNVQQTVKREKGAA